jgi:hypothetical protein
MNDLLKEIGQTKTDLLAVVSSIQQEQFNTVPFKDSWTAAQVCDHILKAVNTDVLYGNTQPTSRPPDEKVKQTADLFLNFDIKFKSPDFILPTNEPLNKHIELSAIETRMNALAEAAKTLDLSATCTDFEVPGAGAFTRLEFVWFFIVHTQRHIHQLKNIATALA